MVEHEKINALRTISDRHVVGIPITAASVTIPTTSVNINPDSITTILIPILPIPNAIKRLVSYYMFPQGCVEMLTAIPGMTSALKKVHMLKDCR